ncbi:glycosyltransferase [Bacteroides sp. 224]|uniref:glycosyltransferase n=1 Tax=Bacteroides sp. 224 TaxID=2302936 RepID=UPI0013D15088|nr:glycosyltransferase [Bacteroides sp. 224]NDV64857.1 glycosyltransferase [Bacteroides sp. 224]
MESLTTDILEIIILSIIGILLLIQLFYYLGLYNRILRHNNARKKGNIRFSEELPPVSVVICAKNESENIRRYLPAILEQDYPQFEVIVINDGSTDESEELLTVLEERYPHLYHSFTPAGSRYISHKKLALTLGIKASKYDWVIFTEANCTPASKNWLRLMVRNFTPGTEVVLGHSGYERVKGWFNKRISFDTLFFSLRYLGFALAKNPYMGIGRNMAYRKELFFKNKGYSAHLNLQRGDDDLFINQIANSRNTRVETDQQAIMHINHSGYYKDWKEEKMSYMATSSYFRGMQRYILGFETFSRVLFYLIIIATIIYGSMTKHWLLVGIALLAWIIRYAFQAVIINKTAKELGEKRRYYLTLPFFDLLQPIQSLQFKLYRKSQGRGDFMRR